MIKNVFRRIKITLARGKLIFRRIKNILAKIKTIFTRINGMLTKINLEFLTAAEVMMSLKFLADRPQFQDVFAGKITIQY
jgi:hypothetical protein